MTDWQQICPSPTCGLLIYDYRTQDNGDSLDLFCPHCDEHVGHFELETMRQLIEDADWQTEEGDS